MVVAIAVQPLPLGGEDEYVRLADTVNVGEIFEELVATARDYSKVR